MRRILLSPRAKLDLSEIWDYTLWQWGGEQAEKYVRELWSAMENSATDPARCPDIGDVRSGYRKTRAGSHVIFFKVTDDAIEVVRILHQKMDFDRHILRHE
ncbi:type II toxin-antitoxin system RelE/ParE family toxin [Geoalkalibacter sp.]|uniref:type II toxin-antitoxin system RelE/ParE family toxin n=1 Tax=Geoalkalibacter sp. TaxID=3041440 RepID=UPI00272E831F|nr:type II toxin-antitoxin system RelE/ParE family toxin [Geoalkalibacter sp.]